MESARCACRACEVQITGGIKLNAICHCDNCRRRTGSAFGWSVYVGDEQIAATSGPLKAYEVSADPAQTRWFCACCGTTLFWKDEKRAQQTGIAGGCFETLPPGPAYSATDDRRAPWLRVELTR